MINPVLQMNNISKRFPGVQALDNASLEVLEGEVHALVGENGAGKSTLMKILNGLYQPDNGDIKFYGETVQIKTPAYAKQIGITMIYQELNPVRHLTVAENLFLGREIMHGKSILLDKFEQNRKAQKMLDEFGLRIKAETLMKYLSIGQMQMVEILKAVSTGAKLIVMDEPTSSLTDEEIRMLFLKISELKKSGVSMIYITHRLEEISKIADRLTVLRDGKYIATLSASQMNLSTIIQLMVGRELSSLYPLKTPQPAQLALEVMNLSGNGFNNVNFKAFEGEVLGFYGLIGAGRSELFRTIFGLGRATSGNIQYFGKQLVVRKPSDAIQTGIAMVPEDRKEFGLVLCRSIMENIALPNLKKYSSGPIVNKKQEIKESRDIANKLRVKMASLAQITGNLSGGNQQKVVLSKWLLKKPRVLILDEPTRGIDVGAKAEIHELIRKLAMQGMAIIMISSDLPEIIGMSDRIIVMGDGEIKGKFSGSQVSQHQILTCALGG